MKGFSPFARTGLSVTFEPCDYEPTDTEFYSEFNKYNESSLWICLMYLMTCFVQYSLELDNTVFDIASYREESCIHVALLSVPWKHNETIRIFYPEMRMACMMYNYNVSELHNMSYKEAKRWVDRRPKPPVIYCSAPLYDKFSWDTEFVGTCRGALYKRLIRASKIAGMATGSFILGIVADIYGRKAAIIVGSLLYFAGMVLQQLLTNFCFVNFLTTLKGIGEVGLDHIGLILFLEYCSKNNRAILVLFTKVLCPVATIMGIHMKKHLHGFCPELRFLLGVPSLILLFYVWYIPESPRWSLSYCRKEEAWNFLYSLGTPINPMPIMGNLKLKKWKALKENVNYIITNRKFIRTILLSICVLYLLVTVEYTKKQYVNINGTLIPYAHHTLLTMAQMISFMNVLPPVIMFRRRLALLWFFLIITVQLLLTLFTTLDAYYIVSMLLMLGIYSVRTVLLLYICETFPTCIRATSYGFINSMSTFLYLLAYMLELHVYVPSVSIKNTWMFALSCVASVAVYFLPEVINEELPDYKRYRRDYGEEDRDTTE